MHIADATKSNRYEARIDGEVVGWLDYRRREGAISFDHAETLPAYRGRGIADAVVSRAVAEARAAGLKIVPVCPYVREWLTRHP